MSDTYEYVTRKNGEVELLHNGSLARILQGNEAQTFLAHVKSGDEQQVLKRFVGSQPATSSPGAADEHPALDDARPGSTPHGDGEVREKDGQENP